MAYKPSWEVARVLKRAWDYTQSVDYTVTARWVFYRLLQDGTLQAKGDYKRLLGYLSKARKNFYRPWHPSTLADDTRRAAIRGNGFETGGTWLDAVRRQTNCNLDKWNGQRNYVELWFEASAMEAQFRHHAHRYLPLLAFRGDVSIPAKWAAAVRIAQRWLQLHLPVKILYYGDLDEKGLRIPETARLDVYRFVASAIYEELHDPDICEEGCDCLDQMEEEFRNFSEGWEFIRVGLNEDQIDQFGIPENPERPGTYQWEGVDDATAELLIDRAEEFLDEDAFLELEGEQDVITGKFRDHLDDLAV